MRVARSGARARGRRRRELDRHARAHSGSVDRWLAGVAVGAALGVTVLVGIVTEPGGPVGWSQEVALLWLVAAAAGGRALLGLREAPAEGEARRSFVQTIPPSTVLMWWAK